MSADLDMNSNQILNLPDPTTDQEPATKSYVDELISAIEAGSATELDDLLDVIITGPTDGQVLTYESGTGKWINEDAAASANYIDITEAPYNADSTGVVSAVSAISAAVLVGGEIYFPKGRYKIDSDITVAASCYFRGAGADDTATGDKGTYIDVVGDSVNGFLVNDDNISFRDLSILGNGGTRASSRSNGSGIVVGTSATLGATVTTVSGNTTITAASSVFTAAHVGNYIRIAGAGTEGASNYHYAIITSQAGTTAVLSVAPTVSAGGLTANLGKNVFGFEMDNVVVFNHGVGVKINAANRYNIRNSLLHGFDAIHSNNLLSVDSGDSSLTNNIIYTNYLNSSPTDNVNLTHNSGGGLRLVNNKFLDCLDSIRITWTSGISGGIVMENNSMENCYGDQIDISGDSSDASINGVTMTGNWINGGLTQLKIANTINITDIQITGNSFHNGAGTADMVRFGALCNGILFSDNTLNGNGGSGVGFNFISGSANGIAADNRVYDIATRYSNSGTNTYVFDTGNTGILTVPSLHATQTTNPIKSTNIANSASVQALNLVGDRSTPATNDIVYQSFSLNDSAGNETEFARLEVQAGDITNGSEDGTITLRLITGGSLANSYYFANNQFSPVVDGAATLGAGTLGWNGLYLNTGTAVNWENSDVTITHSSNALSFAGATTNGYSFADGPLKPSSNDGIALGVSGTAFSDLFLASGGVIDFNAGEVQITHSANKLTITGITSEIVFNGGGTTNVGRFLSSASSTQVSFQNTGGTPASVSMGSANGGDFELQAAAGKGLVVRKAGGIDTYTKGAEFNASGDLGGIASTNGLTGISNLTTNSTGVGTILFKGTTNRNSSGFIKIYIGTTAYYVPVFSAITA